MRKYLKYRILAGVGHNHHPSTVVPPHRGYTPPICLILNTFCGLRFCVDFFTIYYIYSSVQYRVRSLYRVICVWVKWKFVYLWLYIWGVERDTASESVQQTCIEILARKRIGAVQGAKQVYPKTLCKFILGENYVGENL